VTAVTDAVLAGFTPAQVRSIAGATARVNVWHGAIRSGKTVASLIAWLLFVLVAPRSGQLVIVGRTRESVHRNVFAVLTDPSIVGKFAQHISYTAGAPTAKMFGRTVHVLGASDSRAENVLRGLTVAGAYVDEATLVAEAFWTQLLGRMSVPGARLFATTNPDGPAHWFNRQVLKRAKALHYRVFRFKMTDNTFLEASYIAKVSREYTGLWYRRFILGEWVQAEGAVYGMWDEARHVIRRDDLPDDLRSLYLGVDYGDVHPTRGYLLGIGSDLRPGHEGEHRLYVLDEWAPGSATIGEHAADLKRWLLHPDRRKWAPQWIAYDPAAASFGHQLHHDGFGNVQKAHKPVVPGIQTVAGLLAVGKLAVVDTCTNLIDRIPGYVWDDKATARGETAPVKADDDEVDALRYAIFTSRYMWRGLVPLAAAEDTAPGTGSDVELAA
jgi:PBSX family phage terminase large subunit